MYTVRYERPLFIDKLERGQALGAVLLEHARKMAGNGVRTKNPLTTKCRRIKKKLLLGLI